MSSFLTFDSNEKKLITVWSILKADIFPWILSAGFTLLLFAGVVLLIGSANPKHNSDFIEASAALYTFGAPFYYALVVLACLLARRSRDVGTWILVGVLIIFFVPQTEVNLAVAILPNSVLAAITAMIGFLALGRIVEYLRMRYVIKLDKPQLSVGAFVLYCLLVLGSTFLNSSFLFKLLWE